MIVVDAGPLNFLIRIDSAGILTELFDTVLLPYEVFSELTHPHTPPEIATWLANLPSGVSVARPQPQLVVRRPLHLGELAAIYHAHRWPGCVLLVDDQAARTEATRQGLRTARTLGILLDAAALGLLDFEECLSKLLTLDFRISEAVRSQTLARWSDIQSRRRL